MGDGSSRKGTSKAIKKNTNGLLGTSLLASSLTDGIGEGTGKLAVLYGGTDAAGFDADTGEEGNQLVFAHHLERG